MDSNSTRARAARERTIVTRAKPQAPRIPSDCLARARLLRQLDAGLARALILVSAPAGFGKTTLLAQWAARTSLPVAWVTVREQAASTRAFFASVMEAIQSLFPGATTLADTAHLLRHGARAPYRYIA